MKWNCSIATGMLMLTLVLLPLFAQDESVEGLIQLADPLDEPEFYCVDVPGFGASLDLDAPLSAHTCKPNADDELFTFNSPGEGQFYMDAYDLCMQAESAEAGVSVILNECSDEPLQQFSITGLGQIRLDSDDSLCLAIAPGDGTPTGGPSHLRRDLSIESCDATDVSLTVWHIGVSTPQ